MSTKSALQSWPADPPPGTAAWLPEPATSVLAITGSAELQGEVGRVSAAAAVGLDLAETVEQSGGRWDGVAAVLIGSDVPGVLPGWRGPTVVVGPAAEAPGMWLQASRLGADRVAVLPDSAQWLANYLARLRGPTVRAGVVGVVGGCGGAGASTLSALLAAEAGGRGMRTLLVDGDLWGGGLEVAVAGEEAAGLRWPDLVNASGAINPEQLAACLPQLDGFSLLSWSTPVSGGMPGPGAAGGGVGGFAGVASEVVHAAREAFGLVIVDVGRSAEAVALLGVHCDCFVLVVPGRQPAAAAAATVLAALPAAPATVVVRGPLGEGVDAGLVADAVGVPCVAELATVRGLGDMLADGRLAEAVRLRAVRRVVSAVLDWGVDGGPGGTAAKGGEPSDRGRHWRGRRVR